jgi:hypothetical protein
LPPPEYVVLVWVDGEEVLRVCIESVVCGLRGTCIGCVCSVRIILELTTHYHYFNNQLYLFLT